MIVDLFAGPGGWSEGLRTLGLDDIGLEWDEAACGTRAAAGHLTIRTDVAEYPPERFTGADGLIASPPCQDFSIAGKRAGREGDRGQLIDVVPEWVRVIRPRWVACEQVPPALPIWHEHAAMYEQLGYRTWVGVLNAADYGVPQTRRRAVLLASLDRQPQPPAATHAEYPQPSLFGDAPQRWVRMAEALPHLTGEWFEPRGWIRDGEYMLGGHTDELVAPTLTCAAIGKHIWKIDGYSFTEADALTLQTFPAAYPVQGSRAKRHEQIGNAVPPRLAAAVVKAVAA